MDAYEKTFDWVEFPEGRARFSGGIRGGDEQGHETFAIEVNGVELFGEIDNIFLPNRNDFNIEIISFGYQDRINVANPSPGARRRFTLSELNDVKLIVIQLINAGVHFEDPPFVLNEDPTSHFMGQIFFKNDWALEAFDNEQNSLLPLHHENGVL